MFLSVCFFVILVRLIYLSIVILFEYSLFLFVCGFVVYVICLLFMFNLFSFFFHLAQYFVVLGLCRVCFISVALLHYSRLIGNLFSLIDYLFFNVVSICFAQNSWSLILPRNIHSSYLTVVVYSLFLFHSY